MTSPLTILTSGIGLGTYIPALLNQRALRASGYTADVEILEGWFTEPQRQRHLAHRDAFRSNFQLAQIANRMPRNVQEGFDPDHMEAALERWARENRREFIVWSGFWLPVLERYQARVPHLRLVVDLCRIDAMASASFHIQAPLTSADCRDIWLWNWAEKRLGWHIPVVPGTAPPVAFEEREPRLLIHGGGWAIGTYAQVLPELARSRSGSLSKSRYALDVIAPRIDNWPGRAPHDRHFAPLPDWHPWQRSTASELVFPPLRELGTDGQVRSLYNDHFPPAHTLVREAQAIVSKPGGGTLIDSLAAATPVVLLEPYGDAEARNGDLWEHLGFGIRYARWKDTGFDPNVLARLHRNLLEAAPQHSLPSYPMDARPNAAPKAATV